MGANSGPATYSVGLNNVGSYQVAGTPYITGSTTLGAGHETSFAFPMVTKTITVINRSAEDIRVHFNSTGSGRVVDGNHFVLFDSKEDSYTFNVKATELYVSAPAQTKQGDPLAGVDPRDSGVDISQLFGGVNKNWSGVVK